MATITVNGKSVSGTSIRVNNGKIFVDGQEMTPHSKVITIQVQGDINLIDVSACDSIHVSGTVGTIRTMSGNVRCGGVTNSVETMSGNIDCGSVGESATSMSGSVRRR